VDQDLACTDISPLSRIFVEVMLVESVELKSRVLKLLKEDEEFRYAVIGLLGLDEVIKRLDRHEERLVKLEERLVKLERELVKLRRDMNRGFELVNRHIAALGARWGLMAEEAFRESLRGILGRELGLKVERWKAFDEKGLVFGYPSEVEIDVAITDGKTILVEISSHVKPSDVYTFKRKAELYVEKTGRKPVRLLMVTPFAEDKAFEASIKLGVEIYTKV